MTQLLFTNKVWKRDVVAMEAQGRANLGEIAKILQETTPTDVGVLYCSAPTEQSVAQQCSGLHAQAFPFMHECC